MLVMLIGDKQRTAEAVARRIGGIAEVIADVLRIRSGPWSIASGTAQEDTGAMIDSFGNIGNSAEGPALLESLPLIEWSL